MSSCTLQLERSEAIHYSKVILANPLFQGRSTRTPTPPTVISPHDQPARHFVVGFNPWTVSWPPSQPLAKRNTYRVVHVAFDGQGDLLRHLAFQVRHGQRL